MIFPHEKLIFVPIPKTGTVSISTWLRQFMGVGFKTSIDDAGEFGHPNHPTLAQCHQKIIAAGQDPCDYRSFSFIRNPWAHLYSVWAYGFRTRNIVVSWDEWMIQVRDNYEKTNFWKEHKFKGFLDRLESPFRKVDYVGTLEEFDKHIATLKNLILDNHIKNHYNTLRENWPELCRPADQPIPERFQYPKHINASVKDKKEYLTKYTPDQIETVSKLYERDIREFGYRFNHSPIWQPPK